MTCPQPIAEVLAEILQTGLLRIRASGWQNNAAACAVEADHVHNLPVILTDYAPALLHYYWEIERAAFQRVDPAGGEAFALLWSRLEQLLPANNGIPATMAGARR